MLKFSFFSNLLEAKKIEEPLDAGEAGNASNSALGNAFESLFALRMHELTGSRNNNDPEHIKRIESIRKTHEESLPKVSEKKRSILAERTEKGVKAYLESLKRQGVNPEDIIEVHHTNNGIDRLVGRKVRRSQNPHDVTIRLNKSHPNGFGPNKDLLGPSLKFTAGTASNNGVIELDKVSREEHGIDLGMNDTWDEGKVAAGIKGKPVKEIKKIRDNPKIERAYQETRGRVLSNYQKSFMDAPLENQKKHLGYLMKAHYDAPYEYVNAEKGYSTPIEELPQMKAMKNAQGFTARLTPTTMHVYDHEGNHILAIEHRATHGPWSSIQVNAKYGTMQKPGDPKTKKHKAADPDMQPPPAPPYIAGPKKPRPRKGVQRIPQTDSPIKEMPTPGVNRPPPSQKLSPEGVPEHMYQAHRDTESYMGFRNTQS